MNTATPLLTLARETLGVVETVADSALPPNLLRLRDADGRAYLVKQHTLPSRYVREVRAYRTWTRHLASHAPELVACDDARLTLLLTALPGRNAASTENNERLHHRAGAVLGILHQATATGPLPGTGLSERLRDWTARAERAGLVSLDERQYLTHSAVLLANTMCDSAVCHLDYQPQNWLTGPDGFGVCDFEHSRFDARVRDFARLQYRHWRTAPHLRDAFFDGYGRHPSHAEYLLLETFGAIEAVTALVRGHERQDPDLSAHGRAILTHFS
ncbi:aminoglycoside phosphotransferase [Streptomyces acidiscabies]|uniref:aminoglycoside phosphotransferase n=1 Tax=Streptomyces acidiscabies TaxID=42234 RepID=UPI0038F64199